MRDCYSQHRRGQEGNRKLEPLQRQVESRMVALMKEHVDIFTWSSQDMPGQIPISLCSSYYGKKTVLLRSRASMPRIRVTLFHDVTHHDIECYDMIAKSQSEGGHSADRGKSCDRLKQFKLRLNSSQCTIRVQSGCSPTETVYADSCHFVDFRDGSDRETGILGSDLRCVYWGNSVLIGMEAVLPVEVQIPSLRVLMDVKLQEAEWVRTRYEELSLIEEKRLAAICHGQLYQQRMKRAFDRKVRPRVYHVGDMVLKRILPLQNDRRGKWTPNYEGPFVVKKVFSGGALLLATMDGEDFPSPVNADAKEGLKRTTASSMIVCALVKASWTIPGRDQLESSCSEGRKHGESEDIWGVTELELDEITGFTLPLG
ncbi:hypothetical protein KIW84_011243 [Lathyrus oleraceus]|uniref:Uncharacterized protein n=1 Tax=Pisum sativum TaxID=3888 RepID=A0A9D4YLZ6_PEA|nr:hypothetical protein KIW84_011243 [Pisum sativum]